MENPNTTEDKVPSKMSLSNDVTSKDSHRGIEKDEFLTQALLELRKPKSRWQEMREWLNVLLSGAMVVITFLLVFWAAKQWDVMNRQWEAMNTSIELAKKMNEETSTMAEKAIKYAKEQAEGAKLSANASLSSAEAAKRTAQIAEESLKTVERAYIGVKEISFKKFEAGQKAIVKVTFQNAGKMPALNTRAFATLKFIPANELIKDLSFSKDFQKMKMSQTFVPTGFKYDLIINSSNELSSSGLDDVDKGKYVVYVYGVINYDSAVGHHLTRFCNYYAPQDKLFYQCDFHNDIE